MKYFETAYFGSFSLLNGVGAAAALKERRYGLAAARLLLSCMMASYAANAAANVITADFPTLEREEESA